MSSGRVIVLLPCHTLDDFPTWLDESEADDLLASWTAAWHPAIIAAVGHAPGRASVDLPPPGDAAAGIVPAFCDARFVAQADPENSARWVRSLTDPAAIAAALADRLGVVAAGESLPGERHAADFAGLGLAELLAELLARRMRMEADLAGTGFEAAVVAAARAAVAGDDEAVRAGLAEAHGCLEATRSRYYSVASWAIDTVLLAPTTLGRPLIEELRSPVPLALVATGATVRRLAERHPESLAALREAVAAGRVEPCGGRDDERPLDACAPETIRESLARGREAWREHVGRPPACHAAIGGGASAILPQLLDGCGCRGAIWNLFDGTPLPDPGGGRIRWEGTGGGAVEAIARPPLDAGRAATILELPERIGDALDHDHVAIVQFAHYAGRASRWHDLVRRIGASSGLLGTFATPGTILDHTEASGTVASFEPDAFAITPPPAAAGNAADPLSVAVAEAGQEAQGIAARSAGVRPFLAAQTPGPRPTGRAGRPGAMRRRWLPPFGRRDDDSLALDNGVVELRPHPRTGGLLSLRRPVDRGNRISQQLAICSPAPDGGGEAEPGEYGRMEADAIVRQGSAAEGRVESRGRLVAADGRPVGRFVQSLSLVPDMPLAVIDVEVELDRAVTGPLFESHVACRFAWHENEHVELRRSLHLQSVVTQRRRFTAPHFIEIVPQTTRAEAADAVAILTGGLPWHLHSNPHVVDSVLIAAGATARRRLAVGIGVERPWDAAVELASGRLPAAGGPGPATVRLTLDPAVPTDPPGTARIGLVESAGRAGEVRMAWARDVLRAVAVDLEGRPQPDVPLTVDGRETTVFLRRYQWLHLVLEFAPAASSAERGGVA